MNIQAFIFNWPGKKQHAAKLEAMFRPHCETFVINSDDSLRAAYPHWQHVGNEAYFTDQWNAAIDRFNGDILMHIQADVWPVKVGQVLSECAKYIKNYGVGVYAPNVDFNAHYYRKDSLPILERGVFVVPATDCCFWGISRDVIRDTPRVDSSVNRLGWGIEYLVGAVARRKGLKIVRDYRFTAGHPKGSGYKLNQAFNEWRALRNSLEPSIRQGMESVERDRERLLIVDPPRNSLPGLLTAFRKRTRRSAIILHRRAMAMR
jgi:hypothetical protein